MESSEMEENMYEGDKFQDPDFCTEGKSETKKSAQPAESDLWSSIKRTLVVVVSSVVVLAAIRNSLTLHLQNFWGASGDFWQHQYDKVEEYFDHDDYKVFMYGSLIAQYVIYWTVGVLYIVLDATLRPEWFRKYKVQPGTNEPVDKWRLFKAIAVVHFNQTVVAWVGITINWHALVWRGYDNSPQLPTFGLVLFELSVFLIVEEIGFYYAHRLFHHRFLYKHVHKMHHEWQSPIAIVGIYCHPLEHLVANVLPVVMGPMVMGSHVSTAWLWVQLAQLSTLNSHSGYHLPFFPSNESHDYHHLRFNQCYGMLGVLDHLHGTDRKFKATRSHDRHLTLTSLTPAREAFPDQGKQE